MNSFKKFCLKSSTKEADRIYNYYIKMEEIVFQYIKEKFQEQNTIMQSTASELQNKHKELLEKSKEINIKDIELNRKTEELNNKNSEIKELLTKLTNFKNITYEEIESNQSVYVFSTDIEGTYKIGESSRDIIKRKKELQTSCVKSIVILFEFKTFNSKMLEEIIHNILNRYRCNSSREHFRCNIDYIKNLINIAGTCLNTLKSSYQDISKEELIDKILDKLKEVK